VLGYGDDIVYIFFLLILYMYVTHLGKFEDEVLANLDPFFVNFSRIEDPIISKRKQYKSTYKKSI
jgi:hypothetical protein